MWTVLTGAGASLLAGTALGQTSDGDRGNENKEQYTMMNPTPTAAMRPMEGDRPDLTESPLTVDAGHVQIETGLFRRTSANAGSVDRVWAVLNETNVRIGMLNHTELQVLVEPYRNVKLDALGASPETVDGFGDVTLRVKQNLWGNDQGETALALMPGLKIPTGTDLSNDRVEGSVIASVGWGLAPGWGLGVQLEPGAGYRGSSGYQLEVGHTLVFGFPIAQPVLGGYVEYGGLLPSDAPKGDYEGVFSTGLTISLGVDADLDVGSQIGLTDAASTASIFTGIAMRW